MNTLIQTMLYILILCMLALGAAKFLPMHELLNRYGVACPQLLSECGAIARHSYTPLLVNRSNPLPHGYAPERLVRVSACKPCFKLESNDIMLEQEAFEAANCMFAHAAADGIRGFTMTSGYRSEEKQRELYANDMLGIAAPPEASEHRTGLAFDVTAKRIMGGFTTTPQYHWLMQNCWSFGFILRYPPERENITGIEFEPWHYRYVGIDTARMIRRNGWTLEEYCYLTTRVNAVA